MVFINSFQNWIPIHRSYSHFRFDSPKTRFSTLSNWIIRLNLRALCTNDRQLWVFPIFDRFEIVLFAQLNSSHPKYCAWNFWFHLMRRKCGLYVFFNLSEVVNFRLWLKRKNDTHMHTTFPSSFKLFFFSFFLFSPGSSLVFASTKKCTRCNW